MQRRRIFCSFLLAFSALALSFPLYADTIDREGDNNEIDVQALREWINTKRQVTVKEIGGNLSISGEVRTEFQKTGETKNGMSVRGSGTGIPSSQYDIAANILMDYRADVTWSSIKLEFDNDAGIFQGTLNKIKLARAYFGARAYSSDDDYLDFEVGRRKMGSVFDSKLEFSSYLDGGIAKYTHSFERMGDIYATIGVFLINEYKNQYGYAGETGFMNIAGSGFYTKFSLIDWDTKNLHDSLEDKRFDFLVSQLILGYKFYPAKIQKQVTIYLGGLYNSKAKKLSITDNKKANWGTYLGFSMGQLRQKGDWSLDVNYQLLAAQAVPDFDVSGIGVGNADKSSFYTKTVTVAGKSTVVPTTRGTAGGDVNYRGISITLDYLLSTALTIQQQWQQSVTLDHDIGPSRRYKQYEIEFIYGF